MSKEKKRYQLYKFALLEYIEAPILFYYSFFIRMFLLIIFFFSIIIKSVNSICNTTEFYPCACCDPIFHHCVHNAANIFSHISSFSAFKRFNLISKLDTSTYCCVPKDFERNQIKKDNITLFKNYCKNNINLHDSLNSIVNKIISSCDPISKRCYDVKNPIVPALLPIPKRPSDIRILSPTRENEEVTTRISSIIINEDEIIKKNLTKDRSDNNKEQIELVTISVWVPDLEQRIPKYEEDNTNRAIRQFQSIGFLILILIINIVFSN
jgi:hypothetical protein